MSHTRNIYFSDETWKVLESLDIYDDKGKLLSRSNKIAHCIKDKMKDTRTADAEHFERVRKYINKALFQLDGLEFIQHDQQTAKRIRRAIKILNDIKIISY
tara:strand:- start:731 stop:1033 length:303 start_codon:yes stop_codon:yes gene_type:complete